MPQHVLKAMLMRMMRPSQDCCQRGGADSRRSVFILGRKGLNLFLIKIKKKQPKNSCIRQFCVKVKEEKWKFDPLVNLYETISLAQGSSYATRVLSDFH